MRRVKLGRIADQTQKRIALQSAKYEDVEFSALEADRDDVEAIRRSEAADKRQVKEMFDHHEQGLK